MGESITVALGPDGSGTKGFDRPTLGANVGGADPYGTRKTFSIAVAENDDDPPQVSITMGASCVTPSSWAYWNWLQGVSTGATTPNVRALAGQAVSTLEGNHTLVWMDVRETMPGPRWERGAPGNWPALRTELNRLEGCRSGQGVVSEGMAASFSLTASPAPRRLSVSRRRWPSVAAMRAAAARAPRQ